MKVNCTPLTEALKSLQMALDPAPRNDRERDGAIQRFEYTFELSWKTAQKILKNAGIDTSTPREVLRALGKAGWIPNVEEWFEFLDARNQTSHTYSKKTADEVFAKTVSFAPACEKLLEKLKEQSQD